MDWEDEISKQAKKQEHPIKPQAKRAPDEDEDTMEYAERPAFVAVDAQVSVFDQRSINKQQGINTQPSIFHSTWK